MTGPATFGADDAAQALRMPTDHDDKYSRGVVGMRTGSSQYPGAAVLGVEAAWRTGAGMVRYLGADRPTALVLQRRPETVAGEGRVQASVLGSGTDAASRTPAETEALHAVLAASDPVVVDAGALDLAIGATAPVVITPHGRELDRLRAAMGLDPVPSEEPDRVASVVQTARASGAAVLLKGARTIVATPDGWHVIVDAGTPWLATAGTGDVLGGVLGALVAVAAAERTLTASDLGPIAASAAWIHGQAARHAASGRGPDGGPITALDVAEALPFVVGALLPRVVSRELQD